MAPPEDQIDFTPAGTLHVVQRGEQYLIGRPTIGEHRKLTELWADLKRRQAAYNDEVARRDALSQEEKEALEPLVEFDQRVELVGWYRLMFDLLEVSHKPLPEDNDDLPSWFQGVEVAVDVQGKWLAGPYPAGANPREQEAAAALEMMNKLTTVLPQIMAALPALTSATTTP